VSATKKNRLGKGIGSLMDDYSYDAVFTKGEEVELKGEALFTLPINKVHPNPNQPRKQFDQETLDELAESIKNQGILQPLLVEKISDDDYAIVAGERRYRAALAADLEEVPVIVKEFTTLQRMEVSLIENIQRENLNPIEEAQAYLFLLEKAGIKQEELAQRVGKKRSTIANSIRLLQLDQQLQNALLDGELTPGHARALLSVINPADRKYLYERIIEDELSVRNAEKLATELNLGKRGSKERVKKRESDRPVDLIVLEQKFLEATQTKVKLKGTLEKGKIEISYYTQDDLERLYNLLVGEESIEL
jgi:ParB family chromosome partitioning protein